MTTTDAMGKAALGAGEQAVKLVIRPRPRDLGGLVVRRALPNRDLTAVGPFIFFDEMGPVQLPPGQGIDVRPHPHIGLSTLTWLIEGEILHRDSIGSVVRIRPGEVNWMTAGAGVVHSERTPPDVRAAGSSLHGLQMWLALPRSHEETAATFEHFAAPDLPVWSRGGCRVVLIAGSGWGARAPVSVFSPTLCADATLAAGATLTIEAEHEERALYPLAGTITLAGARFGTSQMVVLRAGVPVDVGAESAARFVIIGGAPLDGPRHLWWNFVSSRPERIEQAKADWAAGRFARVAGDDAFIPLPEA
ncbi:MAG: pirin family protein [Defluviicoccus sp.]